VEENVQKFLEFSYGISKHLQRVTLAPSATKGIMQTIPYTFMESHSWLLITGIVCLLTGCPTSSEWDRQWEQMHAALSRGELQEAKGLLHRLLPSVREKGPTDERYALVIFQLGEVSRLEGQESQAEAYYWEALPLFAQFMGPEHLRMADPLAALASVYHHKGQPDVAVPLLKRALAIREKSWGLSDPQILPTLQTYYALLITAGRQEEAMDITGRIERILKPSP
jgi:tetratricopeptide (TPR) repeat protein